MFSYLRNTISFFQDDIITNQCKRLKNVEIATKFSKEVCALIHCYEATTGININSYEEIEYTYLPELRKRLKIFQDKLTENKNRDSCLRIQKQLTIEAIASYKDRQAELAAERRKLGWTREDWQREATRYSWCTRYNFKYTNRLDQVGSRMK